MRRLTKFVVRSASVAALLALSLAASTPARAGGVTPLGTIDSTSLNADGSLRAFNGYVTPFGPLAGILQIQVLPTGAFTGEFVFAARGGTVYGTIQGQFFTKSTYMECLTITGGTGIYTGISGYVGPIYGTLNLSNGTAHDTVTGGQVCPP